MSDRRAKPFSMACENNREPILEVLRRVFADRVSVLEIGSGTGQHAVHFGRHLRHLTWQTSDVKANHEGIALWLEEVDLDNVLAPVELDVQIDPWPAVRADGVFTANTAHIMHWPAVEAMFRGVGRTLEPGGLFVVYGPFSYSGRHTRDSNARFDASLRAQDPGMGVRDLDDLSELARGCALELADDVSMPANNRMLIWRRLRTSNDTSMS